MSWVNSPWTMFQKDKKSPLAFLLVAIFVLQPVVGFVQGSLSELSWFHQHMDPTVRAPTEAEIYFLNQKIESLHQYHAQQKNSVPGYDEATKNFNDYQNKRDSGWLERYSNTLVAQLEEYLRPKQNTAGSNPVEGAKQQ